MKFTSILTILLVFVAVMAQVTPVQFPKAGIVEVRKLTKRVNGKGTSGGSSGGDGEDSKKFYKRVNGKGTSGGSSGGDGEDSKKFYKRVNGKGTSGGSSGGDEES